MLQKEIHARAQKAVQEKIFPGCVVGIIGHSKRLIITCGHTTYESTSREDGNTESKKTAVNTIYDIASLTKVFTASLLILLIEQERVRLDDSLIKYIPEFETEKRKEMVCISHLLAYALNLSLPSLSSLRNKSPQEIIDTVIKAPFQEISYDRKHYTNATAILMGLVIEKATGKKLPDLLRMYFIDMLRMAHTTFYPRDCFTEKEIAPTEMCRWRRKKICGDVHDEGSYALGNRVLGAAGLFATVPDLLMFLKILLHRGTFYDTRIFKEDTVKKMIIQNGYGWMRNSPSFMGKLHSSDAIGMTGFTGTSMIFDPKREIGIVILTNRTWPRRSADHSAINSVRKDIADIIYLSLDAGESA